MREDSFSMPPQAIFCIVSVFVMLYWLVRWIRPRQKKSVQSNCLTLLISALILSFSWIWFVPIHMGQRGEVAVCKFRFQVLQYDIHDYSGSGNCADWFLKPVPNKYGSMDFQSQIGGWQEYFGFEEVESLMED